MFLKHMGAARGRVIVALALGVLILMVIGHVARQRSATERDGEGRTAVDRVVVVSTAAGRAMPTALTSSPPQVAGSDSEGDVSPELRDAIVRALHVGRTDRLSDISHGDATGQVLCGAVTSPSGQSRRFVYLGVAGLGAIDDGSKDFAAMRARLCG